MEEQSDALLVALARSGDKEAFGRLIERYQTMAHIITLRLIRDSDIAREMAQEAMLQAYLSLDHLRDDTRFKGWFYGIVLNVCHSYLREQKRAPFSLDAQLAGLEMGEHVYLNPLPDPEEELEERELRQLIYQAVKLLSPKNRAATLLFYYEQLSLQEIATKLGISVVAVKSRLHQARKELKAWLCATYPEMQPTISATRKRKTMIKVSIVEVVEKEGYSIVILQDDTSKRALPVWVGYWEGTAIASTLSKRDSPGPLTFHFMANLLQAAQSELQEVRLESLKDNTLYAVTRIRQDTTVQEVEARPGDALALAAYTNATVYVADEVIERLGVDLPPGKVNLDSVLQKLKDGQAPTGLTRKFLGIPNHPRNLQFTEELKGWGLYGSRPQNYEVGIDRTVKRSSESSAYLKAKLSKTGGFGTLMQTFSAEEYGNKRVRLSAYLKSEDVQAWAGLWMRIDGSDGQPLGFDNMQKRPVRATTAWQCYEVVLDVPKEALHIAFGVLLVGAGQVWIDALSIETVGQDILATNLFSQPTD